MMSFIQRILIFTLVLVHSLLQAQPANYWTNTFNTEASLLSGAVVGGNAEITAIFYNPAGISDVEESRIELNASLFSIEHKTYKNPLGEHTEMDHWFFRFYPRFASYLFPSKKYPSLTYQFAVFNRNHNRIDIYDRVRINDSELIYKGMNEQFTGLFNLSSTYDDYWGSMGISKRLNPQLSIGVSLNVSVQNLEYFKSAESNVIPENFQLDSISLLSSAWTSYERIKAYNWRFIGKIGLLYKKPNWSMGFNVTLPSLRLFGSADVNKTISQTNIIYQGQKLQDYYINEYPENVFFKMQDPLSIALGLMVKESLTKSDFFLTVEYFHYLKEYLSVDATKQGFQSSQTASEYSSYLFANNSILNIAIGYKKMLGESLGFLAGFRTDFNPYEAMDQQAMTEINTFANLSSHLFHFTGGIKFDFKKSSFILGLQHTYGTKTNQEEFVNFSKPNAYNPETGLALQGLKGNSASYTTQSLGFYLGFSISF